MNNPVTNNQPVSDDNDLAKVLSGADGQAPAPQPDQPVPAEAAKEDDKKDDKPAEPNHQTEELETIKKHALEELRPLVDKLELPPEEKFDILLLIIRSTDDEELVGKAHDTSIQIQDETRKAQALLDIIKEVDYFANK